MRTDLSHLFCFIHIVFAIVMMMIILADDIVAMVAEVTVGVLAIVVVMIAVRVVE